MQSGCRAHRIPCLLTQRVPHIHGVICLPCLQVGLWVPVPTIGCRGVAYHQRARYIGTRATLDGKLQARQSTLKRYWIIQIGSESEVMGRSLAAKLIVQDADKPSVSPEPAESRCHHHSLPFPYLLPRHAVAIGA